MQLADQFRALGSGMSLTVRAPPERCTLAHPQSTALPGMLPGLTSPHHPSRCAYLYYIKVDHLLVELGSGIRIGLPQNWV